MVDFFHAHDISEGNFAKYTGKTGDTIAMSVSIQNRDGTLVEQGLAQKAPGSVQWIYTTIAENSSLEGGKIVIKASDLPGYTSEKEKALWYTSSNRGAAYATALRFSYKTSFWEIIPGSILSLDTPRYSCHEK